MSTTRPFVPDDRGSSESNDRAVRAVGQVRRVLLAGAGAVVARARDFTREALHDWGWLPGSSDEERASAEDILLVVSELVTNACLHAGGAEELRLLRIVGGLRMEVADGGGGRPEPRIPHRGSRPGGHGMYIVQRLCADWGTILDAEGPGKTVWAEIAVP
jgi:signal transduction histidine kinase